MYFLPSSVELEKKLSKEKKIRCSGQQKDLPKCAPALIPEAVNGVGLSCGPAHYVPVPAPAAYEYDLIWKWGLVMKDLETR